MKCPTCGCNTLPDPSVTCECGKDQCFVGGGYAPDECRRGHKVQPEFINGKRWLSPESARKLQNRGTVQ